MCVYVFWDQGFGIYSLQQFLACLVFFILVPEGRDKKVDSQKDKCKVWPRSKNLRLHVGLVRESILRLRVYEVGLALSDQACRERLG